MSAEQKAKCYNKLVDLAYEKVVNEQATITSNQMAAQLNTKVEPYDTIGLYNAVMQALEMVYSATNLIISLTIRVR